MNVEDIVGQEELEKNEAERGWVFVVKSTLRNFVNFYDYEKELPNFLDSDQEQKVERIAVYRPGFMDKIMGYS